MTPNELVAWVLERIASRRFDVIFILSAIVFEFLVRSRQARRLLPRGYLLDLVYCGFYRLGIYFVLLDQPLNNLVYSRLTVPLFLDVPVWLRAVIYVLLIDLTQYWVHRLQHAVPVLWAFHQVHHSQQELSMMATYRLHPVDMWARYFFAQVIFMFLLGVPPAVWLPITLLWDIIVNLAHLDVKWTFGPLRWVFVTPVSHAIHHSVEERHQSKNHAMVLSFWDRLFGTWDGGLERPVAVGLPGWRVRESLLAHWWQPIRGLVRHYRGQPRDGLAPLTPAPPAGPPGPPAER